MKKVFGDYYLGLDMGTSSIGWAVTDMSYNILKFNGKAMWGIRLFDDAETSADTRVARSARRRIAREKWRISLLQELLSEEISKLDMGFFVRQKESRLHVEDKSANNKVRYSLFDSSYMSDKEYYEKYPTIYHLRKAMLENKADAFDVRLLYLVVANFYKHRGHFLLEGISGSNPDCKDAYDDLINFVRDNMEGLEDWSGGDISAIENILKNKKQNITNKKKELEKALDSSDKRVKTIAAYLSGGKAKLSDLFANEDLKECDKNSFSFKTDNYEEIEPIIEQCLGDSVELVGKMKAIYDWSILIDILGENEYISQAKANLYDAHMQDLRTLKNLLAKQPTVLKKKILGDPNGNYNYSKYVGSCMLAKGEKLNIDGMCNQEDLCKFLNKELGKILESESDNSDVALLKERIELGIAFPKQVSKANGVIPMQVNCHELEEILKNAEQHLPFLAEKDETGLSISQKLVQIMRFRIPYYIGPLAGNELSRKMKRCWVVRRKKNIPITPWNFDEVIDKAESANRFIRNMTNKCTYLPSEDVLPKNSLLYSEFMARNELNCLNISGNRLPEDVLEGLFDYFMKNGRGKVTKKRIAEYLKRNNLFRGDASEISGIDDVIKSELKSYKDFCRIFGREYVEKNTETIENIIKWITVFSDEKSMLVDKIREHYPEISYEQLKQIKKLQYKDWGRFSETLLDSSKISYLDDATGEYITIISAMRRNALNFMELISDGCMYGFRNKIDEFNDVNYEKQDELSYEVLEKMYISPAVRRSLWQTVQIVEEIKRITGHAPKRIFIEMAREEQAKQRTKSRKEKLIELYKDCKNLDPDLQERVNELNGKLNNYEEDKLRSDRLYLYFLQLGKCMYTGEKIELEDIFADKNGSFRYDIDHIYPRSKTKDDSLDNRVLVYYKENREKTDEYPLKDSVQAKMKPFWKLLKDKDLISSVKYERLIRKTPLTEDELAGFINRQLVETRQSTKAAADIFKLYYPESEVVYSKAGNVSDFRQEFNLVKCRDINDFHHAKDAYLNIVVGNAYHVRFTNNPIRFIKELKKNKNDRYTLKTKEFYSRDIVRGDDVAWIAGENSTLALVKATMAKNNILYTRMPVENKGQLYDLQLVRAGKGKLAPKKNLSVDKYGGYNGISVGYFVLVESENRKGQKQRSLEAVPIMFKNNESAIQKYLVEDCELKNPRIILKKILNKSLVKINDYMMSVTGISGNSVTANPAVQLVLGQDKEAYLKKVFKVASKYSLNKDYISTKWDNVTVEKNIMIYDVLVEKHRTVAYSNRPATQIKVLEVGRAKFEQLSLAEQCAVLAQVVQLFTCNPNLADITLIKGSKSAGRVRFNKVISNAKSAVLYNQSITGLFEQKIDLLKL